MECRYHHRLAGPSHSIFDRFNNVQSLEITSPFFLIIIIIIITMIALLSVSVGRFWQVCICVAMEPWVYACVCECYVKPFQRDRFDSWLHFSLAHKEYKQTQIMVSTLDSITSLCWCYMLFSRSGIFAHFVFHAQKYMYFCCFFLSFSLTLLQLLLFRFDLSAFWYWSIWIYVWVMCVRARLSFNFIQVFPLFLVCFWMNGREANTLRSPITWFSFFCVCGCMLAYFLGMAAVDDFDHAY